MNERDLGLRAVEMLKVGFLLIILNLGLLLGGFLLWLAFNVVGKLMGFLNHRFFLE